MSTKDSFDKGIELLVQAADLLQLDDRQRAVLGDIAESRVAGAKIPRVSPVEPGPCTDTWWSYECLSAAHLETTGVIVDMRVDNTVVDPDEQVAPDVQCPLCCAPMHYRGHWSADPDGYGSQGDGGTTAVTW